MAWKYWINGDECAVCDDDNAFWEWFVDLEKRCDPILVQAYHLAIAKALLGEEKRARKKKIPRIELKLWFSTAYDQADWDED